MERDNIILFPKTVEYYQVELTRLLENERYADAADILRFLIRCSGDDPAAAEEWKLLLHWLETEFPTAAGGTASRPEEEGEEATESELLSKHVAGKASQDDNYVKKLLEMLLEPSTIEKKLIALEQLAFAEHPAVTDTLKRWVETVELHPFVQFKALQTLRRREAAGTVTLHKHGETASIDLAAVPVECEDYPGSVRYVIDTVKDVCEISYPMLTYFSEQLWKEFLAYVYGTGIYAKMVDSDETELRCWAAALHHASLEALIGEADPNESAKLYGVGAGERHRWERAHRFMKNALAALKSRVNSNKNVTEG